jgi:predicted Fe-Mo cluster-binding NifX family protein
MKIAISSNDGKYNTPFSSRFGRCTYFIFFDTVTGDWEAKPNPAVNARGGAGPQTVQFLANNNVEAAISGRYGPNAFESLDAAGIQAFEASEGTPEELLAAYKDGSLKQVNAATGPSLHH